jgi:hypothetical protein
MVYKPLFLSSRLSSSKVIPPPKVTAVCLPAAAFMILVTVLESTGSAPSSDGSNDSNTRAPLRPATLSRTPDGASFLISYQRRNNNSLSFILPAKKVMAAIYDTESYLVLRRKFHGSLHTCHRFHFINIVGMFFVSVFFWFLPARQFLVDDV